ncbi:cytochrome P450 [Pseudaestuariivita rosea]|uniref:cytochrome P450 n=1 Tax=Pseudaestuariivita rosea TaxID=2763263 RepID=UPI001ABBBE25|nr:cytochrome P450 [Pseudaestuariivita rosea]
MQTYKQSPTDDAFVQDPYTFYDKARSTGSIFFWDDYAMPCVCSYAGASAVLKDRRFGREAPVDQRAPRPDHQAGFWAVEDHSMLELEPPRHTKLRKLVLRAFTSRRINDLQPEITQLSHDLLDDVPSSPFDLLPRFAERLPVTIIARLIGVPDDHAPQLLAWSHAMVRMYQASRTEADEQAAAQAATDFSNMLKDLIADRRKAPRDDLLSELLAARDAGAELSEAEVISTCILLLNAGHEATVHTIGNGVKALLEHDMGAQWLTPDRVEATVEEILRYDPPLHLFTRWVYEDTEVMGHQFHKGDQVAVLLGAANRDPGRWEDPHQFRPNRPVQTHTSFGAGIHFCLGAPLARLELQIALPILFTHLPNLHLTEPPQYANSFHFHGLEQLMISV